MAVNGLVCDRPGVIRTLGASASSPPGAPRRAAQSMTAAATARTTAGKTFDVWDSTRIDDIAKLPVGAPELSGLSAPDGEDVGHRFTPTVPTCSTSSAPVVRTSIKRDASD